MIREHSVLHRLMRRWTSVSYRRSSCIVALGEDMADRLEVLAVDASAVRTLPLWADLSKAVVESEPAERCCFQYSGNMGRGHGIKCFLDAAEQLAGEPGLRWVFSGEGPRKAEVEAAVEAHPDLAITIKGYVPKEELYTHLSAADVHLVSMRSTWEGCIMPSKIQAAFAMGRPVLFVGPASSSPARWILDAGAGWVVEPGDEAALIAAVREASDVDERQRRGNAGRTFAELHFDPQKNCNTMCEWLEQL
jgi:glycosyltransferase involved in cell wall biosynthesis